MRLAADFLNAKGLVRAGLSLLYYATARYKRAGLGRFTILMYHRVLRDDDAYSSCLQPGMYVRQSSFRRQLEFLKKHYEIVSLQKMLDLVKANEVSLEKQYCVITFDDGWLDNYQYAFPLLRELSVPATIFLTASYVGTNRFFWHEKVSMLFYLSHEAGKSASVPAGGGSNAALTHLRDRVLSGGFDPATIDDVIEALKPFPAAEVEAAVDVLATELGVSLDSERTMLSWEEVGEMGMCNISFGSHTCEHKLLTQISDQDAALEVRSSLEILRARVTNFIPVFCYPNGFYNARIRTQVIDAGYSAAVGTKLGKEPAALKDPYTLKRIGIHDDISRTKSLFAFRLR